jgi:predicted Na+-dependent transporter
MVSIPRDGGGLLLKVLVNAGVPVLVFLTMLIVGMELTADDFRRVARQPWVVVAASGGQCVLLPVIDRLLVHCLVLQPGYFLAQAPILVAAVLVFRRVRVVRGIHLAGANPS